MSTRRRMDRFLELNHLYRDHPRSGELAEIWSARVHGRLPGEIAAGRSLRASGGAADDVF